MRAMPIAAHSVWIDATVWKFDNHTNLWKNHYHNIFHLTFKDLGGSEATIAVFHSIKPGLILAFGRIFFIFWVTLALFLIIF